MSPTIPLHEWNLQALAVVQAMLGAVSPNFRMVTLGHDGQSWHLRVTLERHDEEDREEIENVVVQWEALQDGPRKMTVEVEVNNGPLTWPTAPTRALYRRREQTA